MSRVTAMAFRRRLPGVPSSARSGSARWGAALAERSLYPRSSLQQQVRSRHDGNKAFEKMNTRKVTKKQRKRYHRKLQKLQAKQTRHSEPGSVAGKRREWNELLKRDFIDNEPTVDQVDSGEYEMGDALLDNLFGNAKELSSQATPEPRYLGHQHRHYFNQVADQMEAYRLSANGAAPPPPDADVALALRAYRDKQGTRQKPVGLAKALQHLVQDLQVPLHLAGERVMTTLMTCCRTPTEGRRCLQLQTQQNHPISAYSWSILADIYSKVGDYQGCNAVLDEMAQVGGVTPTLAAYTSLLAACFKVCNDGRVAHTIRAAAGELGWRKWKEMRIVGVEPDVMAYGAILRLTAARGKPEQALNLLEEMQQMQVKPTTLCFSSALRAVARSHSTAVRYEHGSSPRHLQREHITKHHGKLARTMLIMAENAEVEQDEGFVSALILCAAAAGDVATAKAIYVASQVRRMDHLRTIGSDEHLARLRGEDVPANDFLEKGSSTVIGENASAGDTMADTRPGVVVNDALESTERSSLPSKREGRKQKTPSFGEREYGKDTRTLTAILRACSVAADKNGMGTIWAGRENRGYLCENSLRLIATPRVPRYEDISIPGERRTDNLIWEDEYRDQDFRADKRRPRKFQGLKYDETGGSTLDDLDETFHRMFVDKDGRRKKEYRATTPEEIWKLKYGDEESDDNVQKTVPFDAGKQVATEKLFHKQQELLPAQVESGNVPMDGETKLGSSPEGAHGTGRHDSDENATELYFDYDTMRWKERRLESRSSKEPIAKSEAPSEIEPEPEKDPPTELYFDDDEMRWKTRSAEEEVAKNTSYEKQILSQKRDNERVSGSSL